MILGSLPLGPAENGENQGLSLMKNSLVPYGRAR